MIAPTDFGPLADPMPPVATPKTGGMFGGGKFGLKEALAFGLAGLVSRQNPQLIQGLMQTLMLRQKQQQDEAQYQQHRGDELTDYAKKQQIEQQYATPPQPHYFQSNSGDEYALGPDGKPQLAFKDPFPFKFVPNGMGGVVPIDMRSYTGGSGPAPKPLTDDDIIRMSGGQTPPASGGFSRY